MPTITRAYPTVPTRSHCHTMATNYGTMPMPKPYATFSGSYATMPCLLALMPAAATLLHRYAAATVLPRTLHCRLYTDSPSIGKPFTK